MSKEGVVLDEKGNVISDLEGKPVQEMSSKFERAYGFQSQVRMMKLPGFVSVLAIPIILAVFLFFGALATVTLAATGITRGVAKLLLPASKR